MLSKLRADFILQALTITAMLARLHVCGMEILVVDSQSDAANQQCFLRIISFSGEGRKGSIKQMYLSEFTGVLIKILYDRAKERG